jgi:hypothetical protein
MGTPVRTTSMKEFGVLRCALFKSRKIRRDDIVE